VPNPQHTHYFSFDGEQHPIDMRAPAEKQLHLERNALILPRAGRLAGISASDPIAS
jgi:hypothetical protein